VGNIACCITGKHALRVFESRVQGEVFGCKEVEVTGELRKLIRNFVAFTPEPILLGRQNKKN